MSDTSNAQAANSTRGLVQLNQSSSTRKIFCIHQSGGDVGIYRKLARHLNPHLRAIGIQSRLLDGMPEFSSTDEMAEHYANLIEEQQPAGSILLVGFSFGGFVATTIARLLAERGREAGFLGLIDSGLNWAGDGSDAQSEFELRLMQMSLQFQRIGLLQSIDSEKMQRDIPAIAKECFGTMDSSFVMQQLDALGHQTRRPEDRPMFASFVSNFLIHCNLLRKFTPQATSFSTPLHLWWPSDAFADQREAEKRNLEWGHWFSEVRASSISGSHYSIMREPAVGALAEELLQSLQASLSQAP